MDIKEAMYVLGIDKPIEDIKMKDVIIATSRAKNEVDDLKAQERISDANNLLRNYVKREKKRAKIMEQSQEVDTEKDKTAIPKMTEDEVDNLLVKGVDFIGVNNSKITKTTPYIVRTTKKELKASNGFLRVPVPVDKTGAITVRGDHVAMNEVDVMLPKKVMAGDRFIYNIGEEEISVQI